MRIIGNDPKAQDAEVRAVASGALTDGSTVVVNSDGTVGVVEGSSASAGTPVVFESDSSNSFSATYDSNAQKVVVAYQDNINNGYGTAVVGTVSGSSISFGTPVVYETADAPFINTVYDSNAQKVVIVYRDGGNSDYPTAIVGTVTGTSISFGSHAIVASVESDKLTATYDSNAQKVVVAYQDEDNSNYGTAAVGNVSGTSISFGTPVVFESANTGDTSSTYDANAQKVVIAYQDSGNLNYGTGIVGTVSGTSISFGSATVFESASASNSSAAYDSNAQKVVVAYRDGGNSLHGTVVVGTVSGTSISFGSPVVFESASTTNISTTYDSNAQKIVIAYKDVGNSDFGTAIPGVVSGTSISFEDPVVFESANSTSISATFDSSNNKVVIAYQDVGNSGYGTAVVFSNASTNLTSENFIGFSDGAYADGDSATIQAGCSVTDAQSGLTAGQAYYVQTDGTLSETPDDPSVLAGTALSATKLLIKG